VKIFSLRIRVLHPTDSSCCQVLIVPLFPVVDLLLFWHCLWKGKLLVFL
jgi:hypothetical protein